MARPRTFDEALVARRAREAFHDHGYTATSVEQLTAATGLRRSSLYGAFGDKHGLFLSAFGQYCDEEMAAVRDQLAGADDEAYERLGRHLRSKTADPAASRRGCLLAKATAELADQDPDVARISAAAYDTYEQALTGCFRAAQTAGDARGDLDPQEGGALLLTVLRGIEALGRAGRSEPALRAIAETAITVLAADHPKPEECP
ncbi:TetR/AcrR family transcriptional regulator [Nocardia sp. alder85J]|uniref:TetR/AcrR family transcriptional regulator n=1 Tax=Nocardia sp. alder85J TaxID=2862949 RepID=UPI001CD38887|nr:TetR/AcrR family transcriptional regulator [Nocardia sp. alder85J]MCX4091773.1 TetR/AcrR family transcriptional regulator [Nocardia sp. alder85J]